VSFSFRTKSYLHS